MLQVPSGTVVLKVPPPADVSDELLTAAAAQVLPHLRRKFKQQTQGQVAAAAGVSSVGSEGPGGALQQSGTGMSMVTASAASQSLQPSVFEDDVDIHFEDDDDDTFDEYDEGSSNYADSDDGPLDEEAMEEEEQGETEEADVATGHATSSPSTSAAAGADVTTMAAIGAAVGASPADLERWRRSPGIMARAKALARRQVPIKDFCTSLLVSHELARCFCKHV